MPADRPLPMTKRQLDLFDEEQPSGTPLAANDSSVRSRLGISVSSERADARVSSARATARAVHSRVHPRSSQVASHVLTEAEMPSYPEVAVDAAISALRQLPREQLWFTYKDVAFFFGVSRATVARRLSEGLVPGVRMAGTSVIEDAAVRRFDREQLKWLLLALRHRPRRRAKVS